MDGFQILLDAPDTPAGRLQIATLGDSFKDNRYGEFAITRDNVASWQRNLNVLPGGRALIDLDHSADRTPRRTEAAGWITGVGWDGDTPVADVEWTPVGKTAIEEKRYLFFSPTYGDFKDEHGTVHSDTLVGGALTNKPFLTGMPAITLASEERVSEAVDAELERLVEIKLLDVSAKDRKQAAADGNALADGSYPIRNAAELHSAAVLAASGHGDVQGARKLIRKRATELGVSLSHLPGFKAPATADSRRSMDTESLIKTLGLEDGADDQKILDAITELTQRPETAPEVTETEPVKTLAQLAAAEHKIVLDADTWEQVKRDATSGKQAADELREQRFTTTFDKAQREMRAVPAQLDQYRELYASNPELALKMLDEAPQILNAKPIGDRGEVDSGEKTLQQRVTALAQEEKIPHQDAYLKVLDQIESEGGAV